MSRTEDYKNFIFGLCFYSLYIPEYTQIPIKPSSGFKIHPSKIVTISFVFEMSN